MDYTSPNDLDAVNQTALRKKYAAQVAAFDAACADLGIGAHGNGETVTRAGEFSQDPAEVVLPRFEAECTVVDGQFVSIVVQDLTVPRTGARGQEAVSYPDQPAEGGTEEARRLANTLRERVEARVIVEFKIVDQPSRSKGWARWRAVADGRSVLATKTGTEWGSGRVGDTRTTIPLAAGTRLDVELHVELITGRAKRRVFSKETVSLTVSPGGECEVEHKPGSQGLRLQVTGAVLDE